MTVSPIPPHSTQHTALMSLQVSGPVYHACFPCSCRVLVCTRTSMTVQCYGHGPCWSRVLAAARPVALQIPPCPCLMVHERLHLLNYQCRASQCLHCERSKHTYD